MKFLSSNFLRLTQERISECILNATITGIHCNIGKGHIKKNLHQNLRNATSPLDHRPIVEPRRRVKLAIHRCRKESNSGLASLKF